MLLVSSIMVVVGLWEGMGVMMGVVVGVEGVVVGVGEGGKGPGGDLKGRRVGMEGEEGEGEEEARGEEEEER